MNLEMKKKKKRRNLTVELSQRCRLDRERKLELAQNVNKHRTNKWITGRELNQYKQLQRVLLAGFQA